MTQSVTTVGAPAPMDVRPGDVNAKASDVLKQTRELLTEWSDRVATITGTDYRPLDMSDQAGRAMWLAHNVHTIAGIDGAGEFHAKIAKTVRRTEDTINLPTPPRFCGVCTTEIDGEQCGLALYARRDTIEVVCPNPKCKTVHNVERLFNRTLNTADHMRWSREVLIGNQRTQSSDRYTTGIMGELGEFVHWRTFHDWCAKDKLRPAGFVRPDGRRGITRHSKDDVPEYRLADVRRVRRMTADKTGKAAKAG
jgi:hypothetical protein